MHLLTDDFEILPSECDETAEDGTDAFSLAKTLAERKCRDVADRCGADDSTVVIGCDTVVIDSEGEAMGKPRDDSDAFCMLKKLSGGVCTVSSGVCIYFRHEFHSFSCETKVAFYDSADDELRAYIATGEPHDKAGAYAIQGQGALLIKAIEGDYNNVVGMPVSRLARELENIVTD
jgi:septum formation protein